MQIIFCTHPELLAILKGLLDIKILRVHENKLLIYKGLKKTGKSHNKETHNLYCLPCVVRSIKSRRMDGWANVVACKKTILNIQRCGNIYIDITEIGYGSIN